MCKTIQLQCLTYIAMHHAFQCDTVFYFSTMFICKTMQINLDKEKGSLSRLPFWVGYFLNLSHASFSDFSISSFGS